MTNFSYKIANAVALVGLLAGASCLAGCSTFSPSTVDADLQKACAVVNTAAQTADATLTGGAKNTADKVAAPGLAFCAIVAAGALPSNADANSVNWLTNSIAAAISTVTALAKGA